MDVIKKQIIEAQRLIVFHTRHLEEEIVKKEALEALVEKIETKEKMDQEEYYKMRMNDD
jgi:hypothetical protein